MPKLVGRSNATSVYHDQDERQTVQLLAEAPTRSIQFGAIRIRFTSRKLCRGHDPRRYDSREAKSDGILGFGSPASGFEPVSGDTFDFFGSYKKDDV